MMQRNIIKVSHQNPREVRTSQEARKPPATTASDIATRGNQRDDIIARLAAENGGYVSAVELAKTSLQYSARIHEARALKYVIESRVEFVDGKRRGFFRLVSAPPVAEPAPTRKPPQATPTTLFDIEPARRHRDDG